MKALLKAAIVGAVVLTAVSARADVIGPFNTLNTIESQPTDFPAGLHLIFPKFDQKLGTLTKMTISLSSRLSTNLTVTATGASSGTVRTDLFVTAVDPNNTLTTLTDEILTDPQAFSIGSDGGTANINGVTKSNSSTKDFTTANVNSLANYVGATGTTFALDVSTFTQTLLATSSGNTSATQTTVADARGTVTYTFVPIPEPASMILTGIGVCVLGVFARRLKLS